MQIVRALFLNGAVDTPLWGWDLDYIKKRGHKATCLHDETAERHYGYQMVWQDHQNVRALMLSIIAWMNWVGGILTDLLIF